MGRRVKSQYIKLSFVKQVRKILVSKIYKSGSLDKYDGYMPNKAHWIHDDYYVSNEQREFHTASGWAYREGHRRGFRMGVNNKMYKASPMGTSVDHYYVGKSDNL